MSDLGARELTIYVRSRKVVTGFYHPAASRSEVGVAPEAGVSEYGGAAPASQPDAVSSGEAFFLSDDQAACVARTEEVAMRRGYTVKVIDLGRANPLERLLRERVPSGARLPLLLGPGSHRLEGVEAFTEERLCAMMPAELAARRAFTYLKVRGGNLDPIRATLLGFAEVRELHVLTGDWDLLAVLEFPDTAAAKRQVLDFVTNKIRSIPEILDTSTLLPELSVTKFPF
jgi:DNA-binding Lrp family transcriptional regulator